MWPKFLQSKWSERLFTAAISIIGITITLSVTGWRESRTSIRNELSKKASIEYVDKQDSNIKEMIRVYVENADKQNQSWLKLFESMESNYNSLDHKVDILITKQK